MSGVELLDNTLFGWSYRFVVVATVIYFIAGLVKGTLGIGFPTTAVSLIAQFIDARTAISLVILPMVVTNAWQVWRSGKVRWVIERYWRLLITMLLGIAFFSQLSSLVSVAFITAFLGGVVTLYSVTSLYKPIFKIPDKADHKAQYGMGICSGLMGGIAGVWAPPVLIYLNARGITKDYFVATTGLLLFTGSLILLSSYWSLGFLGTQALLLSAALLIPSMIGVFIGETIRNKLSSERFQRLLLWFFLIMGLNLIRRAVAGL